MSRRTEKRRYGKYNKFDVVYADFGKNPHGIQGGIRPGIIISCDASNHDGAPQVSVVPLSSKLSVDDYKEHEKQMMESRQYSVEKLFCSGYARFFWEAIKLRYPEYCFYVDIRH